ncbi:oxygenase MpaB family protein [Psychroserpens sp. SPM9]|uniref:oxygenase MpaB family protein n=1 Tax=Psychroserpens sp. SPM9 TaxID=2975598 RepID=UPI0021A8CFB0|nr:oxygenase MpaB family protein [Psychroserpens sp. SPM9]MDG5492666.1 oxygenase MpaB family protein [Psychroserpens sp. SPM9]
MEYFVDKQSIVREIWGDSDTILLIFAGASAEFALNKAVDWLYFTGQLPKDPLGRLFSTVSYARTIVFAEKQVAFNAIDKINAIHGSVEKSRGKVIPNWAYKDVLFMLIDYSIRAYEILERKLERQEREAVFKVFYEVGKRMHISDLPKDYEAFKVMRHAHIKQHLYNSDFTKDLYKQYRKHLGLIRFKLLIETQIMLTPQTVVRLLELRKISMLKPLISVYKMSRIIKLDGVLKSVILPSAYKKQIKAMNISKHKSSHRIFFNQSL